MTRVWSQLAQSKSIAANFNVKEWQSHMVVPLSTFADQDVLKVIMDNEKKEFEECQINQAKCAEVLAAQEEAVAAAARAQAEAVENRKDPGTDPAAGDACASVFPMEPGPVHQGFLCDGCRMDPIIGIRWKCMECASYDLCDPCHVAEIHNEHKLLGIEPPADIPEVGEEVYYDDITSVLLGFRVYSKGPLPVHISGQLANGQTVPWKKTA